MGAEDWGGGHLIFRRTERGITENIKRIQTGGSTQICFENEDMVVGGGAGRKSHQMSLGGDHFREGAKRVSAKFHLV